MRTKLTQSQAYQFEGWLKAHGKPSDRDYSSNYAPCFTARAYIMPHHPHEEVVVARGLGFIHSIRVLDHDYGTYDIMYSGM